MGQLLGQQIQGGQIAGWEGAQVICPVAQRDPWEELLILSAVVNFVHCISEGLHQIIAMPVDQASRNKNADKSCLHSVQCGKMWFKWQIILSDCSNRLILTVCSQSGKVSMGWWNLNYGGGNSQI